MGEKKEPDQLVQHIDNLQWKEISAGITRTDLALKLAKKVRTQLLYVYQTIHLPKAVHAQSVTYSAA